MKKILFIYGTRPEAIKMAPLVKEFQKHPSEFKVIVCLTGQHRQMLDQINAFFGIQGDYDLNLMKPNQTLFDIVSGCLLGLNVQRKTLAHESSQALHGRNRDWPQDSLQIRANRTSAESQSILYPQMPHDKFSPSQSGNEAIRTCQCIFSSSRSLLSVSIVGLTAIWPGNESSIMMT